MYRLQKNILVITLMVVFLYCLFIGEARSTSGEKNTGAAQQGSGGGETPEEPKQNSKEEGTFDFITNGDDNLQNFNILFRYPSDEWPFEIKHIEASLSGKYFVTFQKNDLPEDTSLLESLSKQFSDLVVISRSYGLRLEGSTLGKFGVGGYIEGERDYSIETDPHLHVTGYAQYSLYTSVKVALGGWAEGRRLGKETWWVDKKTEEKREVERYRYGLRAHLEVEHDTKRVRSSMMIEYLPHLSFDAYRISVSPEFEFKFKVCDKHFALVLHGEIDYYSEEEDLTIEPLVDITKPLEIRWTQLIRHRF